jgi:hypothetical protein
MSPAVLKIPTSIRVSITPVVQFGNFLMGVAHLVGVHGTAHGVITVVQVVFEAIAALLILGLFRMLHRHDEAFLLGMALLVFVFLGPTLWPWYFLWGLTFLAVSHVQRSTFLALIAGGAMFLVGPGGTPMLGGNSYLIVVPLGALAVALYATPTRIRAFFQRGLDDDVA